MLAVGSEGVLPAPRAAFLTSCCSFLPQHTPQLLSSFAHTHARRQTSSSSLHNTASFRYWCGKTEPRGQKFSSIPQQRDGGKRQIYGKSRSVILQTEEGAKQSHLAASPSSLPLRRRRISRSACVFHQKLGTHRPRAGKYLWSRWSGGAGRLNPYLTLYFVLIYFQPAASTAPRGRRAGSRRADSWSGLWPQPQVPERREARSNPRISWGSFASPRPRKQCSQSASEDLSSGEKASLPPLQSRAAAMLTFGSVLLRLSKQASAESWRGAWAQIQLFCWKEDFSLCDCLGSVWAEFMDKHEYPWQHGAQQPGYSAWGWMG